jgi:hypothetical protein
MSRLRLAEVQGARDVTAAGEFATRSPLRGDLAPSSHSGAKPVCDVKAVRLLALTLVFDGRFRNYAPYDAPARFGAVVE